MGRFDESEVEIQFTVTHEYAYVVDFASMAEMLKVSKRQLGTWLHEGDLPEDFNPGVLEKLIKESDMEDESVTIDGLGEV